MDLLVTGLIEDAVRYVDDRYGRVAAWIVAVIGMVTLVAILLAVMWFLLR